jgi:hypothetical protein
MRTATVTIALLTLMSASPTFAQESSQADFQEFCETWHGRWVGDVTWGADLPGLGKRGEKVIGHWEAKMAADGNALAATMYAGTGSSTQLIFFDPGAKKIRLLWVESSGALCEGTQYKKNGKWTREDSCVYPDGKKRQIAHTVTITDGGNTHTWEGTGTIGGEKLDYRDVWRRMAK